MGPGSYWLQSLEVARGPAPPGERLSRPNTKALGKWPFGGDGRRETWAITSRQAPGTQGAENWSHGSTGNSTGEERPGGPQLHGLAGSLGPGLLTPPGSGEQAVGSHLLPHSQGYTLGWGTLKMTGPCAPSRLAPTSSSHGDPARGIRPHAWAFTRKEEVGPLGPRDTCLRPHSSKPKEHFTATPTCSGETTPEGSTPRRNKDHSSHFTSHRGAHHPQHHPSSGRWTLFSLHQAWGSGLGTRGEPPW